jgi:hypothetical protein
LTCDISQGSLTLQALEAGDHMELVLLYTGASARVVSCEYMVQQYCTKPLSGFIMGFIVAVFLSKKQQILTGTFIGQECWKFVVKIAARNGMQSYSKNNTQNTSRNFVSLRHKQKLGYSNQNEKTMRIHTFGTISSFKGKN